LAQFDNFGAADIPKIPSLSNWIKEGIDTWSRFEGSLPGANDSQATEVDENAASAVVIEKMRGETGTI
jgi:hypothetical protein